MIAKSVFAALAGLLLWQPPARAEDAILAPPPTRIEAGARFYPAEDYHQDFLTHNPASPYIATYDLPKIDDLQRLFPARYRAQPVLVSAVRR